MKKPTAAALALLMLSLPGCAMIQRSVLFHPSHGAHDDRLAPWKYQDEIIGYSREVAQPRNVWLMLHGNGGQAATRGYVLSSFADDDSVFVMEYPGYGARPGPASMSALNAAARQALAILRARFPDIPVCVATESIGSGPGAMLARETRPPDKFVFIVPFDGLQSLSREYGRFIPVSLLLGGTWNNVRAMKGYRGPVDVFGAELDTAIPVAHARTLAASLPQARFHLMAGGHRDWPRDPQVRIRYP